MNPTLQKFGYPKTLIKEYTHWCVLLRPQQITLGSLVLAAKSDVTSYADLPIEAFEEQKTVLVEIEAALKKAFGAEKFNYLMLMMVDPNPHFHVLPRYSVEKTFENEVFLDPTWPGPPDLKSTHPLAQEQHEALRVALKNCFIF